MQPISTPNIAQQEVAKKEATSLVDSLNDEQARAAHEVANVFQRAFLMLEDAQVSECERQSFLYDARLWLLIPHEAMRRQHKEKVIRLEERFGENGSNEAFFPYDSLAHFEARFNNSKSPILKARYADFLAVRAASDANRAARDWIQRAVPNYLQAFALLSASNDVRHKVEVFKVLDSAAHLALCRAPDLIPSVVAAMRSYLEKAASDAQKTEEQGAPYGRWTIEVGWILLNLRIQKPTFVSDADLKWWEDESVALAQRNAALNEPFLEQSLLEQAAEAARLRGDAETRFSHMHECANAKVREAYARIQEPGASFLAGAAIMEIAVDGFDRLRSHDVLGLEERAKILERMRQLKLEIRRFYREGEKEMGLISTPLNITPEQIEEVIAPFLKPQTLRECLRHLGKSLWPDSQGAEQWAESQQGNESLMSLLGTSVFGDGMNIGSYSSEAEKKKVEFNLSLDNDIRENWVLLQRIFVRLKDEKGMSLQSLYNYLEESASIDVDNMPLVERGLERYFADDFVSALHILVPQLEDVIRHLFERAGMPPAKVTDRDTNAWQYETFGALLKRADEELPHLLPRDLKLYVERTLCDSTGWNLRNAVAHGMVKMQDCDRTNTETVFGVAPI